MPYSPKQLFYAAVSFGLGAFAFYKTQQVTQETFQPIIEACTNDTIADVENFSKETGYQAYEPKLGLTKMLAPLICMGTQFISELKSTYPAGLLVWALTMLVALPVGTLQTVEAGRDKAVGPIRYPLVTGMVAQVLGISVAVPAIVMPSYFLGRGNGGVSMARANLSILLLFPGLVASILCFWLDAGTYAWRVAAGSIVGPVILLPNILLWFTGTPPTDTKTINKNTLAVVRAYAVSGAIALVGWVWVLYIAYTEYGTNVSALWADLWSEANASVAFMTIDAAILYLSVVVYIAFRGGLSAAAETLMLTPFFGPGAACGLVMSGMEVQSSKTTEATAATTKTKAD